jgi:hypothetical protein
METTMKLAIETYSELTGQNFESIVNECLNGNKQLIKNIKLLMIAVA